MTVTKTTFPPNYPSLPEGYYVVGNGARRYCWVYKAADGKVEQGPWVANRFTAYRAALAHALENGRS